MTSSEENRPVPTSRDAFAYDLPVFLWGQFGLFFFGGCGQVFVGIFNHHHSPINHVANGKGNAAQRHDIGVHALPFHDDECHQNTQWQGNNNHQR